MERVPGREALRRVGRPEMERDITAYCEAEGIAFTDAFHHAELVAAKKAGAPLVRRD